MFFSVGICLVEETEEENKDNKSSNNSNQLVEGIRLAYEPPKPSVPDADIPEPAVEDDVSLDDLMAKMKSLWSYRSIFQILLCKLN